MTRNTRRLFLLSCIALCFLLAVVLATFSKLAPILQLLFVPYQFFLIGICVGALIVATIVLATNREEWTNYELYFVTVMTSVFLLVVVNSVLYKVLGGEQFMRNLMGILWLVFVSP